MRHGPSARGRARAIIVIAAAAAFAGCAGLGPPRGQGPRSRPWPAVRFAVLSDPHLFDTAASDPGPAFEANLTTGPTLLAEGRQILEAALSGIEAERPDFLLVCGDLTKDGELTSHRLAVQELRRVVQSDIRVFVVPGNHDIGNPRAARYSGADVEPAPSVTPAEFAALYEPFGYGAAFQRDPNSLSYAAEAAPGLWILALDSCRYGNSKDDQAGGRLVPSTSQWARGVLEDARGRGIHVIAMLHHGITEQFRGEKTWLPDYVIDRFDAVSRLLAGGGVEAVFTGHTHSQDITRSFPCPGGERVVYDIQTGAVVSWPNAWRMVEVEPGGVMKIGSTLVTALPGFAGDFPLYARDRLFQWLQARVNAALIRFGSSARAAAVLAPQAAEAGLSLFRGDEPRSAHCFDTTGLDLGGAILAGLADGAFRDFQTDLPPADNDVTLDLATGN
jgi:3',5'-cyclic AMP phosphodiesterase CpdA